MGPLAPLDACSYILELLPAFSYLDQMGLVYCDFKIENAIVEGETVKLIDLGVVRRAGDPGGDIYGTKGYAAPEANVDPTAVSDLYTVGRALALLVVDFDFQGEYEHSLPPPSAAVAFRQFPSLHRLLLKATRPGPATRFQSADEMATQLQGVLRDVAAGTGVLGPVDSVIFDGDAASELLGEDATIDALTDHSARSHRLPGLRPAAADPAAPAIVASSLVPDPKRRLVLLSNAWDAHPDSLDLPFQMAGALIDAGAPDHDVTEWLDVAASVDPGDWRAQWYRGQAALARGDGPQAVDCFDAVLAEVPGELAPKLALGYAYELSGKLEPASGYFNLVSKADSSYTSAAFGLARCERARADLAGAVEALERVPASSSRYETARLAIAEVLLDDAHTTPGQPELERAAEALQPLRASVDSLAVHRLAARLFLATARLIESDPGAVAPDSGDLLGTTMHPTELPRRRRTGAAGLRPVGAEQSREGALRRRGQRCPTLHPRLTRPGPSPAGGQGVRTLVRPSRRDDRAARSGVRRTRRDDRAARTSVHRTRLRHGRRGTRPRRRWCREDLPDVRQVRSTGRPVLRSGRHPTRSGRSAHDRLRVRRGQRHRRRRWVLRDLRDAAPPRRRTG